MLNVFTAFMLGVTVIFFQADAQAKSQINPQGRIHKINSISGKPRFQFTTQVESNDVQELMNYANDKLRLEKQSEAYDHLRILGLDRRIAKLQNNDKKVMRVEAEILDYKKFIQFLDQPYQKDRVEKFENWIKIKRDARVGINELSLKLRLLKLKNLPAKLDKTDLTTLTKYENIMKNANEAIDGMLSKKDVSKTLSFSSKPNCLSK